MKSSQLLIAVFAFIILHRDLGSAQAAHVSDPEITYKAKNITSLEALVALALQIQIPIGLEIGDISRLCKASHNFNFFHWSPTDALSAILNGTGYQLRRSDQAFIIRAPDLTLSQLAILEHVYPLFPGDSNLTMQGLGQRLTGWMQMEVEHAPSFAGSTLSSSSSERISLGELRSMSTQDIANRVVTQKGRGIWILNHIPVDSESHVKEEIAIYSYADDHDAIQAISCPK